MGQSVGFGESRKDKIVGNNALARLMNAGFKRTGPKGPQRKAFEDETQRYWPEEHRPA